MTDKPAMSYCIVLVHVAIGMVHLVVLSYLAA